MIRKKLSRILLPLTLVGAALMFFNCHCEGWKCSRDQDPHKRADKIVDHMQKELALTADQTVHIRQIAYGIADSMRSHRDEAMQSPLHEEMLRQLREPSVDTDALNKTMSDRTAEMEKRSVEHRAHMISTFKELHDILTPAQRDKLADFLEKHSKEMKEHW